LATATHSSANANARAEFGGSLLLTPSIQSLLTAVAPLRRKPSSLRHPPPCDMNFDQKTTTTCLDRAPPRRRAKRGAGAAQPKSRAAERSEEPARLKPKPRRRVKRAAGAASQTAWLPVAGSLNCTINFRRTPLSFRGASEASEPGIHRQAPDLCLDSGF